MSRTNRGPQQKKNSSLFGWQNLAVCTTIILIPWGLYITYHPRLNEKVIDINSNPVPVVSGVTGGAGFFRPMATVDKLKDEAAALSSSFLNGISPKSGDLKDVLKEPILEKVVTKTVIPTKSLISANDLPLLGAIPTAG
jgi:hypothetical protein